MVRHVTELYYGADAEEAHTEVRKTPLDTGLQRVITSKLEVQPQTLMRKHRDYFGNVVHHFDVLEPHRALCITAESVVETTHAIACGPEAEPDRRSWEGRIRIDLPDHGRHSSKSIDRIQFFRDRKPMNHGVVLLDCDAQLLIELERDLLEADGARPVLEREGALGVVRPERVP